MFITVGSFLLNIQAYEELIELVFDQFTKSYCHIINTSGEKGYVTKLSEFVSIDRKLNLEFPLMNIM